MRFAWFAAIAAWCCLGRQGMLCQTKVDLGRQGKNVDFSGAERSKPFKVGTELPARCEVGETFMKADGAPGQQLYLCSSPDTWTVAGKELPGAGMSPGKLLKVGEAGLEWAALGGDVGGAPEQARVRGLQGKAVSEAPPNDGDVLLYDATSGMWVPRVPSGQYQPGIGVLIAGNQIAVDGATVPSYSLGSGAPAGQCEPGREYYLDASAGQLYYCVAQGVWGSLSRGDHGHSWGTLTGNLNDQADLRAALQAKADQSHTHVLAGDVTGSMGGTTVVRIQGRAVSGAAPTDGAMLMWNASSQRWEPGMPAPQGDAFDPTDASVLWLRDDFCGGGTTLYNIGNLGWWIGGQGTATSYGVSYGSTEHPCTFRDIGISSTNANDYRIMYLGNPMGTLHQGGRTVPWRAVFIFDVAGGNTDLRARVGFGHYGYALVPEQFIGIRLDHDSSWDGAGATEWVACVCNGTSKSNCTDVQTGVTVSTGLWYKLEIWSDTAATINFRINGGNTLTISNPSTMPSTSAPLQPQWIMGRTGGTGARQIEADFFAFKRTVSGR